MTFWVLEQKPPASRRRYSEARSAWLLERGYALGHAPIHRCGVVTPGRQEWIEFEELDCSGSICGGRASSGRVAFGEAAEVIAKTAGRSIDDPWVAAVVRSLARERSWTRVGRRHTLDVWLGEGDMFHVSASGNRRSIECHGLDWRRMTSRPGVAGSREPELPAIFLCDTLRAASFFTNMARDPSDVWAVDVRGMWVENGPSGWAIVSEVVPAERMRLVRRGVVDRWP